MKRARPTALLYFSARLLSIHAARSEKSVAAGSTIRIRENHIWLIWHGFFVMHNLHAYDDFWRKYPLLRLVKGHHLLSVTVSPWLFHANFTCLTAMRLDLCTAPYYIDAVMEKERLGILNSHSARLAEWMENSEKGN
jgi:hypothetical protein